MSIFQNAVYPDNMKRAERAHELSSDAILYSHMLATQKDQIETAIKEFPADGVGAERLSLSDSWVVDASKFVGRIITRKVLEFGLEAAAKAAATRLNTELERQFLLLFRLPQWLRIAEISRGVAAYVLADLIVSVIAGAQQKEKLQGVIHQLIEPRAKLALAVRRNNLLIENLKGLSMAISVINGMAKTQELPENKRNELVQQLVDAASQELEQRLGAVNEASLSSELASLDTQRGSYTGDDN